MGVVLKTWFIVLPLLLASQWAAATSICLYARATNDPISGHSFIVIENKGKILVTYGFWPVSKHPGSIAINKTGDLPIPAMKKLKNVTLPKDLDTYSERSLCEPIKNQDLPQIRQAVEAYIEDYGKYSLLANNCNHFAIRIFNAVTGFGFPVVQTPLRTLKIIASQQ